MTIGGVSFFTVGMFKWCDEQVTCGGTLQVIASASMEHDCNDAGRVLGGRLAQQATKVPG
jgi:hypothetical protein